MPKNKRVLRLKPKKIGRFKFKRQIDPTHEIKKKHTFTISFIGSQYNFCSGNF